MSAVVAMNEEVRRIEQFNDIAAGEMLQGKMQKLRHIWKKGSTFLLVSDEIFLNCGIGAIQYIMN